MHTDHRPPRSRLRFLSQVLRLAGPYWNAPHRLRVRAAVAGLFLLTVAQVALAVWTNYWNRALFDALEAHSVREVLVQVGIFALIFALTLAITAAHLMVKRWLQLDWRRWLTHELLGRWMEDGRHYRLLFMRGEHDNPDGRIAEDIRIATETAVALAHTLVFSLLSLGLFVDILWRVSGSLAIPGTDLEVPGYMVPLAFVYAGVGALLGWGFGKPLVRSTNALQTAEADFRFGLARARENSEAIALVHGESAERAGATLRFAEIVRDWDRQSLAYMGIVAFSTGYGALLPVFPIMIAAPQYVLGTMSLGLLMQAAQAFQKLTSALSWPVDNLGDIARARASADRVLSLHEDIRILDRAARKPNGDGIHLLRGEHARLQIQDLCIAEPTGQVLLEPFSAEFHRGERVLLTGDPAVTASLFKVIAGLWPWGSGQVVLPREDGGFLFMPQHPFLPEGTLRLALSYPRGADAFSDEAIARALECAGIAWLLPRIDEVDTWDKVLPLRARQRLGFARTLLAQPAWIFMEEATNAFDPRSEQRILEMLRHELPNSTVLAISVHPESGKTYHRSIQLTRSRGERWLFEGEERRRAVDRTTAHAPRG
jgi:putative ATP-binding cassette transporter